MEDNKIIETSLKKEQIKAIKKRKYSEMRNWTLINQLTEKIKVRRYYNRKKDKNNIPQFLNFETKNSSHYYDGAVNVTGYDYYLGGIHMENDFPRYSHIYKEEPEIKIVKYLASVDTNTQKITFFHQIGKEKEDRETIEIFDLKNVFSQILSKQKEAEAFKNRNGYYLSNEELTFKLEGEKLDIKIHFNSVSIPNPAWTKEVQKKQEEAKKKGNKYVPMIDPRGYINGQVWIREK